jgi:pimeloyl-ACP methyl ester carboxylesterase
VSTALEGTLKMQRLVMFGLLGLLFGASLCSNSFEQGLNELATVEINGCKMAMLIRSENINNPVLLYLHGGPGDSLIPFANYATSDLIKDCTVVYWDQRGTGLSYSTDITHESMNINQFIDDTRGVTEYLKTRFKKDKIFILGHSWGSTLGVLAVLNDPNSYYAFIGVGQVVNNQELMRCRIEWLEKVVNKTNKKDLAEIELMKEGKKTGFYLVRDHGGFIHNISFKDMRLIMANSPYNLLYSNELYERGEALSQSITDEAKSIDLLKSAIDIKIPVYFFLGKYDYTTPTEPVEKYYGKLNVPSKKLIWFNNSGHHMDIEEPSKFQDEIKKILLQPR